MAVGVGVDVAVGVDVGVAVAVGVAVGVGVARSCRIVESVDLFVGAGGITRAAAANMFPVFAGESGLIVKVA